MQGVQPLSPPFNVLHIRDEKKFASYLNKNINQSGMAPARVGGVGGRAPLFDELWPAKDIHSVKKTLDMSKKIHFLKRKLRSNMFTM